MNKNFVEELRWRGMLAQIMPGTEELLQKEQVTAYLGTDPTADSLHIGHLCGVMMLRHLQRCGHKPLALVGGATGMIGDPSGKSLERNLLDEDTLRRKVEVAHQVGIHTFLAPWAEISSCAAHIGIRRYPSQSRSLQDFKKPGGR